MDSGQECSTVQFVTSKKLDKGRRRVGKERRVDPAINSFQFCVEDLAWSYPVLCFPHTIFWATTARKQLTCTNCVQSWPYHGMGIYCATKKFSCPNAYVSVDGSFCNESLETQKNFLGFAKWKNDDNHHWPMQHNWRKENSPPLGCGRPVAPLVYRMPASVAFDVWQIYENSH